jgi:hypothetical protein
VQRRPTSHRRRTQGRPALGARGVGTRRETSERDRRPRGSSPTANCGCGAAIWVGSRGRLCSHRSSVKAARLVGGLRQSKEKAGLVGGLRRSKEKAGLTRSDWSVHVMSRS